MADDDAQEFHKGDRVRAIRDLPGIPAGTEGTVMLPTGINWVRYRVRFDNGVERGMLDTRHVDRLAKERKRAGSWG